MGHERQLISNECGDSCYVPVKNIIQKISAPITSTGRTYKINNEDYKKLFLHLPNFVDSALSYIVVLLLHFAKCLISVNKCLFRKTIQYMTRHDSTHDKTWKYPFWQLPYFIWRLWVTKKELKLIFSPNQVYSVWNIAMKKDLLSYGVTYFFTDIYRMVNFDRICL